MRDNLLDYGEPQLAALISDLGKERYRAAQVLRWIYHQGVVDFESMTNLAKVFRSRMAERFSVDLPQIEQEQIAADGTRKLLMRLADGLAVEAVLIPEPRRMTLCVSTQVGCRMGCAFCSTAALGLRRNLRPGEICGQWLAAMLLLRSENGREISNVVLMGMGEPLDNFENVARACEIMLSANGPNLSTRRLTLSTVGLADRIDEMIRRTGVSLAVSLNAPDDATRARIMPINRRFNLERLFDALERVQLAHRRRFTFEYVLIAGVNDSDRQARRLATLMGRVPSKVNLIPLNPGPGIDYAPPEERRVREFQQILLDANVAAMVRKPRGSDIAAACGQLVAELKPLGGSQ
ncbi:MAG: 23S rRNA (adenine(2503)-C(2))-methyltransferase RlmN [Candidatus Alcyoniella australis]|nr:23S rRNA (adenine(2503)-C(2))-methyltransferase RlmN [Candidatus Alcyoniella australis]